MDPISAALFAGGLSLALGVWLGRLASAQAMRSLKFDNRVLAREWEQAGDYSFKLLDDPDFYAQERTTHEAVCAPARFGVFGRILEREERA